jgi:hypothetical protein
LTKVRKRKGKVKIQEKFYQMAVEQFEKSNGEGTVPIRPKAQIPA